MIKKIPVSQLEPGMYVSDFNAGWLNHPFAFNSMLIASPAEVERVVAAGIRELFIDTARGRDVGEAALPPLPSAVAAMPRPLPPGRPESGEPRVSLAEEMRRAHAAYSEASRVIHKLMDDVRLGHQIEIAAARRSVEKVVASVLRNSNAMMAMRRLKSLDNYTFQHSVNVCAMLVSFAKVLDMDLGSIHDLALGGLLHDLGKMRLAQAVLNKPARLSEEEFTHVKSHVVLGSDLIRQLPGVPALALEVLELHHERFDGSGYPQGLRGEEISQVGRMAAIVDVYDAITSARPYRQGISPAAAVQKLFEWSGRHFDPELTRVFLKSVGIYPVGTLVRLESGRLGVVIEQCESHLLTPVVRVMYDGRRQHYIVPEDLDLSRIVGAGPVDKIVGYELPEKLDIDISRFLK